MYTLLITGIIGFVIALTVHLKDGDTPIVVNIFLSILIGLMSALTIGCLIAFPLPMKTHLERHELIVESLQDGSSIRGSFFLGCGQINGVMKYTYYSKQGDLFKLNQVDASEIRIRYTDGQPKIVWYVLVPDNNEPINNWAIDQGLHEKTVPIIEVPRGSIKSNFTLDAQ